MNYTAPGVYIEDSNLVNTTNEASTTNGCLIGITQRGKMGSYGKVTSWNQFIDKFAYGMDSAFISSSDLAYSVYGFFQNGGRTLYIYRVASNLATVSKMTVEDPVPLVISAKDEGEWGNKIKITIQINAEDPNNFDILVYYDTELVERFDNLNNTSNTVGYWIDTVESQSDYIIGVSGTLSPQEETTLAGGVDGISDITDTDYTNALSKMDNITDINFVAIPGQTSNIINNALISYVEKRADMFAMFDVPKASTFESVKLLRKTMKCKYGVLLYPWLKVSDPLSNVGKLKEIPSVGHIMGVYARLISSNGVWVSPAGTEAVLKGVVELSSNLTENELGVLNSTGIVSSVLNSRHGLVVWGARSLNNDEDMKYVSDILLNLYIRTQSYSQTQQFVFKPNEDVQTWTQLQTTVETFMNDLWDEGNGAFVGSTKEQAYFVVCDETNNTRETLDKKLLICDIGYANKKPSEFVVVRISKKVSV